MKERGGFRILLDTYVTEDSGTGVVHQAPYFGEVCHRICTVYSHGLSTCQKFQLLFGIVTFNSVGWVLDRA